MMASLEKSKINAKTIRDSLLKLDPRYLAKHNAVMFAVEIGFLISLVVAFVPDISETFVLEDQIFYFEIAIILIATVWFATFSEALSEAQAKARVDSLRTLEKEVTARKIDGEKETIVSSRSLKPGDEVKILAGEIIPRDGLVISGKAFVDESMMTGESNPVFKEKDDQVIGGTRIASDSLLVQITAEAGRSFLDEMVGLIENAKRPKTQNEIALTILLAGLSIIFVTLVGTLLFLAYYLGHNLDIVVLIGLLVALMPTTIGGLLPAIGISGITRIGRDNIVAKSGKGIEAAGDCDILILDKTGTITKGNRSATAFIPLEGYEEEDVGKIAFAASFHDSTYEGKSIVDLAEQKNLIPQLMDRILVAKPIPFSAETGYSGTEFVKTKGAKPTLQQEESKASKMLLELDSSDSEIKLLKGAIEPMLSQVKNVNEAELRWKAQEVSKMGATPLMISINQTAIGLVALKDNLKENICEKLDEVRATGITTVMITGDNQLTAQIIAKEARVDQVMAEAKPTDKLKRVQEEQAKGHVIGMVGDGTNDAPALAKADIGLAMNSGTAVAKEAANMIDLDSDPSKILRVVKLGKQLLMTRGAITTFSIANDAAKYFAILPAMFSGNPQLAALNIMQLHSPETAVLSTLIFNAVIIPALIPLALKGVRFEAAPLQKIFLKNMSIYGLGGAALPFVAIKAIDVVLSLFVR